MLTHYKTTFTLTSPVNDMSSANKFFKTQNEYMLKNFINTYGYVGTPNHKDNILNMYWSLNDRQHGIIVIECRSAIDKENLKSISAWIKAQHSKEFGNTFASSAFASYIHPQYGYKVYSSFDYANEDYWFSKA